MALIKGRAVDQLATANWLQKKKTGVDIPISETEEMAEQFYRDAVKEIGRDEVDWRGTTFPDAMTSTQRLAKAHMVYHAPLYTPEAVQVRVTRPIDGSRRFFLGFIDAVIDEGHIVDVKTGSRVMNDADTDQQATAYAYALGHPIDFEYLRVIDTGKSPVRQERIQTRRGAAAIAWYTELVSNVDRSVEAGIFPTTPGIHCRWCPIRESCVGRLEE